MSSTVEIEVERSWPIRGSADIVRSENSGGERSAAILSIEKRDMPVSGEEPRRDWAAALALVEEASEAIRMSAERVTELERAAETQARQMREDLLMMQQQLQLAQREITAANQRAEAAEAQARESDAWLRRLDQAITNGFGPGSRNDQP
ncbi:hypothetical protein Sa4125_38950 [Aureimonas sp. SA4125]|uniref:hypothetical protein n=1 Tax=Aureimonas sp. SA4125 TaxID=2826993 RepID=UPI001CC4EF09|nr:hypothetical protein [Aureimonas sp. SA4125]BDA86353.1 hypothetical protein Sa4125_38950 [Aureimonas sp. SA4125]